MKLLLFILLLPCTVLATLTVTDRGTGTSTASTSAGVAFTLTGHATMAAGSTGVLVLAMDNANSATGNLNATSYTDSVGNIWYVRVSGLTSGANATAEGQTLEAYLVTQFASTDTLQVTFNATTVSKAWAWIEVAPTAGNTAIVVGQPSYGVWGGSVTSTAPTITSVFISNGDLIIGTAASENTGTWTADGDTSNGSWSSPIQTAAASTGTVSTSIAVGTQWKIVSATAAQTYNATPGASVDCRVGWIALTEADAKIRSVVRGTASSEAFTTIVFTRPLLAGSMGVLCMVSENPGASGTTKNFPSTFNDTQSNVWTLRQDELFNVAGVGTGSEFAIYTGAITTNIGVTDTMTCTYVSNNATTKGWFIWEFAPSGAGPMSYVSGGGAGTGATGTSPTVTTTSITSGDYVIGVVSSEGNDTYTGDAGTTNGTWKRKASVQIGVSGTATTNQSGISQWKLTTATATQVYNPTLGTSADSITGWISIHDGTPTGLTAQQQGAFFQLGP